MGTDVVLWLCIGGRTGWSGLFCDAVKFSLIIPAAGFGRRLDAGSPKALVDIGGTALVRHTLDRFAGVDGLSEIVVAAPSGAIAEMQEALVDTAWEGADVVVVAGGQTRQESVRCALGALRTQPDIVCVHDAARPLVSSETIEAVLSAAVDSGAAVAASRPSDSIREDCEEGTRPLDRSALWLVETPQAFHTEMLKSAHEHARAMGVQASDDAALVEQCAGQRVAIVESVGLNIKVTRPQDLSLIRYMLSG